MSTIAVNLHVSVRHLGEILGEPDLIKAAVAFKKAADTSIAGLREGDEATAENLIQEWNKTRSLLKEILTSRDS